MGRQSTIKQLPKEIKLELDRLIQNGQTTIDEMVDYLHSQGADVSRSSVGRYSKSLSKALEKLAQAKEITETLVKQFGDQTEGQMSSAMREILRAMIFDMMMSEESASPKDAMLLSKALKDIEHTAKISTDREAKIRKEMREETARKVAAAAENVERIGKKSGISAEHIKKIKEQFLGIKHASEE